VDRRRLWQWEVAGYFLISLVGSAQHFVFDWAGGWRPLALLVPVNESTWEHLKMALWPALVFALIEWLALRRSRPLPNFIIAKTVQAYLAPLVIALIFYAYTAFTPSSLLPNLASFFIAVALGQWASYRLLIAPPLAPVWGRVARVALGLLLVAFLSLTFFAPQVFLFADPHGGYGILP
jgi:hypothetical protein